MDKLLIGFDKMVDFVQIPPNYLVANKLRLEQAIMNAQKFRARYDFGAKLYQRLINGVAYGPELQAFFDEYAVPYLATNAYAVLIRLPELTLTNSGIVQRLQDAQSQLSSSKSKGMALNEAESHANDYQGMVVGRLKESFTFDGTDYTPHTYCPRNGYGAAFKFDALPVKNKWFNSQNEDKLP